MIGRIALVVSIALAVSAIAALDERLSSSAIAAPKKKKKKAPAPAPAPASPEKEEESTADTEAAAAPAPAPENQSQGSETPAAAAPPAPSPAEQERARVEEAKKKLAAEGRKQSTITPGSASRWSNRGAMTPIVSEVPITTPLPQRAVPIAPGAETPGQALIGSEELLQIRAAFYGYHLQTAGQDIVFRYDNPINRSQATIPTTLLQGVDRDIDIFRGRLSAAYERIAGTDIGTHLDLEYRSRANGTRPTDYRINELYLSYGLTDFRGRPGDPSFGISVGRVAVREAGYARADGAAIRLKLAEELNFGFFGGFTGNPYGYNWQQHKTEEISTDWINGGAFLGFRSPRFFANVAGVATIARLPVSRDRTNTIIPARSGLDRLYVYTDLAYLATESIDVFLLGWIDIIGGNPLQSLQAVVAYRPNETADFRVGLGRFSTVVYDASTAYSYERDEKGNRGDDPVDIFAENANQNLVPFDAALQTAVYNSLTLRAGYKFVREFEAFIVGEALLRDTARTDAATLGTSGAKLPIGALRMVPTLGARYRDPDIVDASLQGSYIADDESQAKAVLQASIGRGFAGLYAQIDGRRYFGTIAGTDGGVDLSYTLPRDWFPGRVMVRGMLRYYLEDVALTRPANPNMVMDSMGRADNLPLGSDQLVLIPTQESWMGFGGIEWRF